MTGTGEPGRDRHQSNPDRLVRPYVLIAGNNAHLRQARYEAEKDFSRRGQPALDWTGDPGTLFTGDIPSASMRRDGPARPITAAPPLPALRPAGHHRLLPSQLRWVGAIGTGATGLAVAGSLLMSLSTPVPKLLANACTAAACGNGFARTFSGSQPPSGAHASRDKADDHTHRAAAQPSGKPISFRPAPDPTRSSPDPRPSTSSPAPTSPGPTPTASPPGSSPTPTPTPSPRGRLNHEPVHVRYAVVNQWTNGFYGQFVIVNNGHKAISDWVLAVKLYGDHIQWVWNGQYQTNRDTLYIGPSFSQQTIAPGSALTENFIASGSTTTPSSCTFNGSAC